MDDAVFVVGKECDDVRREVAGAGDASADEGVGGGSQAAHGARSSCSATTQSSG